MRRTLALLITTTLCGCHGAVRDDALCPHLRGSQWQGRGNLQSVDGKQELGWTATTTDVELKAEIARVGDKAFLRGAFTGDGLTLNARMDLSKAAGVFLAHDVVPNAPGKLLPGTGVIIKPGPDGTLRAMPSPWERDSISFFGKHVEFPVGCIDLTLAAGTTTFEDRLHLAGLGTIGFADLRDGSILLADSATGGAVAELGAEHPSRVAVLERTDERVRIAFPGDHGALWVGWVPSTSTRPASNEKQAVALEPKPLTASSLLPLNEHEEHLHVCKSAMTLYERLGDTLLEVGSVAAGTAFYPHAVWRKSVHVTFPKAWFHPPDGARFMLDASAAECATVP